MDDPAARGHPLHAARPQVSAVALVVAVLHGPRQHVGHGLEPAVGMVGEAGRVVRSLLALELVEEQEGIEVVEGGRAQAAAQAHARPVGGVLGDDDALYGARSHGLV